VDVDEQPCRDVVLGEVEEGERRASEGGEHVSESSRRLDLEASVRRRRRWWRGLMADGIKADRTYMSRRMVCAVGRLLRRGWLPMGGELALAALVVREHGVGAETWEKSG
jgi:hypothetical protein